MKALRRQQLGRVETEKHIASGHADEARESLAAARRLIPNDSRLDGIESRVAALEAAIGKGPSSEKESAS